MLIVISFLAFTIGVTLGWVSAERYIAFMQHIEHDHEELFEKNPHPELFDDKGNLNRGDYMTISFDPGFNPDEWDPETDIKLDGFDE